MTFDHIFATTRYTSSGLLGVNKRRLRTTERPSLLSHLCVVCTIFQIIRDVQANLTVVSEYAVIWRRPIKSNEIGKGKKILD